jgi:DNA-binding PadR family transcriptional regulator
LEGQGLLFSKWNTNSAKPRKYYELTDFGKEVLTELKKHWFETTQNMNKILEAKK